jgi:hypothetical protein
MGDSCNGYSVVISNTKKKTFFSIKYENFDFRSNEIRRIFGGLLTNELKLRHPLIYVRSTLHNIFVYLVLYGRVIFKKSCGELYGVKKKGRRYFRNVFSMGELLAKKIFFILKKSGRFYKRKIGVLSNGSFSHVKPVMQIVEQRFLYSNKVSHRSLRGLFKKYKQILDKIRLNIFNKPNKLNKPNKSNNHNNKSKLNSNKYRLELKSDNNINKRKNFFRYRYEKEAIRLLNMWMENNFPYKFPYKKLKYKRHGSVTILYVRDYTSWPFNGCRSKNRLC